jgi:hypothetical protein
VTHMYVVFVCVCVCTGDEKNHAEDEVREVLEPQDEEPWPLQALRVGCREEEEGPHHPRQISSLTAWGFLSIAAVTWGLGVHSLAFGLGA